MIDITVFTPAYNRKETLIRLYESLKAQSVRNFEWIIVDDASTDGTDVWAESLSKDSQSFEICYVKQEHGGKHRAINKGVQLAKGRFFFIVDSDDYLLPNSLALVVEWIGRIESDSMIAGVAGLCVSPDGTIIGNCPRIGKKGYIVAKNTERYRKGLLGDKAEIYKTDLLTDNPFPEYPNEFFLTERVVWDQIAAKGYALHWYNSPIYVADYLPTGLSLSGANKREGHFKNYKGFLKLTKQAFSMMEPLEGITYIRQYNLLAKEKGKSIPARAKELGVSSFRYAFSVLIELPILYSLRLFLRLIKVI